jgi:hypothetical protein
MRRARRQSTPSSPSGSPIPVNYTTPSPNPVLFRPEPESPISLHEWQRSINDRIKTPFPTDFYHPTPSPPPPMPIPKEQKPKEPYGTVRMYMPTAPVSSNPNRNTLPHSASHKSLSQSVTSNLSAALSSVASPSSRRKSRAFSPSGSRRAGREADQASMTSSDGITPPSTGGLSQGYFDDEPGTLNAEKVLENAMRFHQQRRTQQRFGTAASIKSKSSTVSGEESTPLSPVPSILPTSSATMPPMRNFASPSTMNIASFEVLIKELEEEEEERKRKRSPVIAEPPEPIQTEEMTDVAPVPQPRAKRPNPLNEAKRRSTGSILMSSSQPLTPTFGPFDKENSSPYPIDIKPTNPRRVSVTSFGSEHSESKRNSAHEVTFNFELSGNAFETSGRASREYASMMVRSNSVVSAVLADMDDSKRLSNYNFGRRGSVF